MSLPAIWGLLGEDHLPQRLLLVAKMIERVASRKLQADFGISVAQWRVLAFVCIQGAGNRQFHWEAAEIDPAEISRAVKVLLADGLITREFAGKSRKAMTVSPTREGQALFEKIRAQRRGYFSTITGALTAEQRTEINVAMETIAEAVITEREG